MNITLNKLEENIDNKEEISINDLLKHKSFSFKLLVIKINGNLITRKDYAQAIVKDGDHVTILHLMSGG